MANINLWSRQFSQLAVLTLLQVLTCTLASICQVAPHVDHYTSENGLPQISVKSIAADQFGYIWIATEGGVARFDGRNFVPVEGETDRIVSIQPVYKNNSVLPGGRAVRMHAEIGSGGIIRLQDGVAKRDTNAYKYKKGLTRADLAPIEGVFWIHGIPNYEAFPTSSEHPHGIPATARDGNYYLFSSSNITYYRNWKKIYHLPVQDLPVKNVFFRSGRLSWLKNRNIVSELVDGKIRDLEIVGDVTKDPSYARKETELKLFWNPNSEQTFLYLNGSVYLFEYYRSGKARTRLLVRDFDLVAKNISTIYFDVFSGKLLLGSLTQGLFVLHIPQFEVVGTKDSENANIFYAQTPIENGNLILTPTGNILGKDELNSRYIDEHISELNLLNTGDKWIIFRDRDRKLWIRNSSTLVLLSRDGKQLLHTWSFKHLPGAISQDQNGFIWLGVYNEGLYKLDPSHLNIPPKLLAEKNFKDITAIQTAPDGTLLVGTTKGLFKINLSTRLITLFKGTEEASIKSIHPFGKNQFWATVRGKGLIAYTGGATVVNFPADKASNLSSAHCVIDDGAGFLWVTTNKGLFQISKQQLLTYADQKQGASAAISGIIAPLYIHHAIEEGFANNEFNGSCHPCGIKLGNGYISLPSMNGFVWFKPERIRKFLEESPILLDRVRVSQKSLTAAGDVFTLPVDPENVELQFSTPFFGNMNNLDLSYALKKEGSLSNDYVWNTMDGENMLVRYSSINAGSYQLIIRKRTGASSDSYIYKTVSLNVPPVWYLTNWAIACFVIGGLVLIALSVYLYSRYKLRSIEAENQRLETVVASRTNSLTQTMAELETSKAELTSQVHLTSRLLASITHDIQSPLKYITHVSADIAELSEEGKYDQIPKAATLVSSMSDRTSRMLQDLLDYTKVQLFGKNIQIAQVDLNELIKEKIAIFEKVALANGSRITNRVPVNTYVHSDKQLLSIVVHNLLDNATKYTHQGHISFDFLKSPDQQELTISNSGDYFPQDRIDFINKPDAEPGNKPGDTKKQFSELGLVIVKEIAAMIQIRIKVSKTDMIHFHLTFDTPLTNK